MLKNIFAIALIIAVFSFTGLIAQDVESQQDSKMGAVKTNYELINEIRSDGSVNGFVLASCGMCNFDVAEKDNCSLYAKIGGAVYRVEGSDIHDHGDTHADNGLCTAVRVAAVAGVVKDNMLYAKSFELLDE